jgi:hypothetical protein
MGQSEETCTTTYSNVNCYTAFCLQKEGEVKTEIKITAAVKMGSETGNSNLLSNGRQDNHPVDLWSCLLFSQELAMGNLVYSRLSINHGKII